MIRSKIDPTKVKELAWKDYVKLLEKDIKQAKDKGVDKVPVIMISDFQFACGETHALMILGKQSEMTKFYKGLKMDEERKKLKDYSIGFCHLEEENGSHSMRIALEGFGKPSKMKKNSKKLIKKLGIQLKDIIKGQFNETPATETTRGVEPVVDEDTAAKKKREKQVQQLTTGLEKIQEAIGKISPQKLTNKLEHYQQVLERIIATAAADNQLDEAEQADFDRLQNSIATVQEAVNQKGGTLTVEVREKMQVNMKKMIARLNRAIEEIKAL